jgi:hypothetical protein
MMAYKQGGIFGAVEAAMIIAQGAMQLGVIAAQTFAKGGEVKGNSPSKTSDNIPAWLTANEFVQPVDSVEYYGKGVMEALRKRIIPKEVFQGYRLPVLSYARSSRSGYAMGGEVSRKPTNVDTSKEERAAQTVNTTANITNVVDPSLFEKYIQTGAGKNAVINVIRGNAYMVKQALATEG